MSSTGRGRRTRWLVIRHVAPIDALLETMKHLHTSDDVRYVGPPLRLNDEPPWMELRPGHRGYITDVVFEGGYVVFWDGLGSMEVPRSEVVASTEDR